LCDLRQFAILNRCNPCLALHPSQRRKPEFGERNSASSNSGFENGNN
jgi:hypothetical protein